MENSEAALRIELPCQGHVENLRIKEEEGRGRGVEVTLSTVTKSPLAPGQDFQVLLAFTGLCVVCHC